MGGVLSGQSLIRAAELRSVTSELARHQTAFFTFRDKYMGLPGDITNAEKFWGTDPNGCPVNTSTHTPKKETCNGNGDGLIALTTEQFRAWQQLANAGLIEGRYSGEVGANSAYDHDPGINNPALKFGQSTGISVGNYLGPVAIYEYYDTQGHMFKFGKCVDHSCIEPAFKPEEAWNIDKKLDDGKPGTGFIRPRNGEATGSPDCSDGADNTEAAAQSANYNLVKTTTACGLHYLLRDSL